MFSRKKNEHIDLTNVSTFCKYVRLTRLRLNNKYTDISAVFCSISSEQNYFYATTADVDAITVIVASTGDSGNMAAIVIECFFSLFPSRWCCAESFKAQKRTHKIMNSMCAFLCVYETLFVPKAKMCIYTSLFVVHDMLFMRVGCLVFHLPAFSLYL